MTIELTNEDLINFKTVINKIYGQIWDHCILADEPKQKQPAPSIPPATPSNPPAAPSTPSIDKSVEQLNDAPPVPPEGYEIISGPGVVNNEKEKNGDLWWFFNFKEWMSVCAPFGQFYPEVFYARCKQIEPEPKPEQEQSTPPINKPVEQPNNSPPVLPLGFEIISSPGAINKGMIQKGDILWITGSDGHKTWKKTNCYPTEFLPYYIYARRKNPLPDYLLDNTPPTPPEGFEIISSPEVVNDENIRTGDLIWSAKSQKWVTSFGTFNHFFPNNFYARCKQPDEQKDSIKTEDLNMATIQSNKNEIASLRKDVERNFDNRTVLLEDYAELKDQRNQLVGLGNSLAEFSKDYISHKDKVWRIAQIHIMTEDWYNAIKLIKEGK